MGANIKCIYPENCLLSWWKPPPPRAESGAHQMGGVYTWYRTCVAVRRHPPGRPRADRDAVTTDLSTSSEPPGLQPVAARGRAAVPAQGQ